MAMSGDFVQTLMNDYGFKLDEKDAWYNQKMTFINGFAKKHMNSLYLRLRFKGCWPYDDEKEWDEKKKYYCLKNNLTPWDYYQAICKYAEGVKPLLDMFVEATENGMFERIWNNLKPHDKWERGHEIMHAMFFPVIMNDYYKAVTAGAKPNLEEFVMLLAVSDELGKKLIPDNDKLQEAFDKMSTYNSPKESILEGYNYALNHFREKHLLNDDLKKWNETYVNANRELLKEVDKLKQTISNKYNINTEWLRCVCLHRNAAEVKWDSDYIPENAYV